MIILSLMVGCSDQGLKTIRDIGVAIGEGNSAPTNDEVIAGLREALSSGVTKGSNQASAVDGFFKNPLLFIPFPEEAMVVKNKALELGLTTQVENFERTLNRAAEEACKTAGSIFLEAIKGMSISDGFSILRGSENAATEYLREKTLVKLTSDFRPIIQQAVDKVELASYWQPLVTAYNTSTIFTGGQTVNPDLTGYVTDKATAGLFLLIAKEEKNIRDHPSARITDLLKKVFGYNG
jgi:hypothetical protein